MSRRTLSRIFLTAAVLSVFTTAVSAQENTAFDAYSPYSVFGVGDLNNRGTAYNRGMAGAGIGMRNNRFINITNPAAVTARDSLAFMADFGLSGDNKIFAQSGMKSVNNTFNISNLAITFPIWRSSAMMVGITPYSSTGFGTSFDYQEDDVLGQIGTVNFTADGYGSVYKAFVAAGVTFFDRLSFGAEFDYYFGNIYKTYNTTITDASYVSINSTSNLQLTALGGKFGIQYEQPLGSDVVLGLGATYSTAANLRGYYEDGDYTVVSSTIADTLSHRRDTIGRGHAISIAPEIGVGLSLKIKDKLSFAFDYTRSDWRNSGVGALSGFSDNYNPFTASVAESYRFGMEFVPNRYDIRYYMNRVSYRAGAYYKKEYYLLDGATVPAMGITIGATFPIFRWYNGLTVGFEFGQRGSLQNSMIRERYFNFSVGVNIFDIWFQKPRYE